MSLSKTFLIAAVTLNAFVEPALAAKSAAGAPEMNFIELALLAAVGFAFSIRNRKG